MRALCVEVEYKPGSFELVQGVKQGRQNRTYADGRRFRVRGFGWGEVVTSSELILTVNSEDRTHHIDLASFFKENWGKLSKLRQEAIEKTMPAEVTLVKGSGVLNVSDDDLATWIKQAEGYQDLPEVKATRKKQRAEAKAAREAEEAEEEKYYRAMERRQKRELKKRRDAALKLTFEKGWNRKWEREQWQARHEGVLHVLDRFQEYSLSEEAIPIEKVRDLVLDRVVLVRRI